MTTFHEVCLWLQAACFIQSGAWPPLGVETLVLSIIIIIYFQFSEPHTVQDQLFSYPEKILTSLRSISSCKTSSWPLNPISEPAALHWSTPFKPASMTSTRTTTHYDQAYQDKTCQIIDGHFVDQRILIDVLRRHYDGNNFRVKVSFLTPQIERANDRLQLRLNKYQIYPSDTNKQKLSDVCVSLPREWKYMHGDTDEHTWR